MRSPDVRQFSTESQAMRVFMLSFVASAFILAGCEKKSDPVAASSAASSAVPSTDATQVIVIGHAGPLSGASAHLGRDSEAGVRLALEDINAQKLSLAGKPVRFDLMSEDDAGDPKQAVAVAQKLVDSHVNGVIGHMNSGASIPASKLYSDAGIPQISPSSTNPKYTRQGFTTTFRVVADDAKLGGTLGRYAVETLHGRRIAVVDDRTAYGQGVAEEFEKAVVASGGKTVAHEFTTDKATDFFSILTKIKSAKPDLIFFGGMDSVAGPMLKQIKSLGLKTNFIGGDGICTGELATLAGDALGEGQVYCAEAGGVDGEYVARSVAFKERFKAKYGSDVELYAPYAYDAANILVQAMIKADSSDPKNYLQQVGQIHLKGLTGLIVFDEKGDVKDGALTLYTFREGKRQLISVLR